MKYYRLDVNPLDEDARFIDVEHLDSSGNWHDVWMFSKGRRVDQVPFSFVVSNAGAARDFTIASFNIPVVSIDFKCALEQLLKDDIQFVPIKVGNETAYCLNVLSRRSAIDHGSSLLDIGKEDSLSPGKIRAYFKLVIDSQKAGTSNCFRLNEFTIPIIASGALINACNSAQLTGMAFEPCNADR